MNIQESSMLLNRIGIILNLIAGFLIAPELIGEERLKRFEIWMKERLHRINKMTDINQYTQDFLRQEARRKALKAERSFKNPANRAWFDAKEKMKRLRANLYYLILIGLWVILYKTVEFQTHELIFTLSAISIFIVVGLVHYYVEISRNVWLLISLVEFSMNFLGFVLYPFFIVIFYLLFLLIRTVMYLFYQPTRLAIHTLQGRDRLKSIVVSLGIVLFIVGNLFQFISTFGN